MEHGMSPQKIPEQASNVLEVYQHDSPAMFRFVVSGDLSGDRVVELEHAWTAAKSILNGRQVVVDVSGIRKADDWGFSLLCRMRESGACLTAPQPPASQELVWSLGLPVALPRGRFTLVRVLRSLGL
jgi:ABC-type transporter Mla MlaB component